MQTLFFFVPVLLINIYLASRVYSADKHSPKNFTFSLWILLLTIWMLVVILEDVLFGSATLTLVRIDFCLAVLLSEIIFEFALVFPSRKFFSSTLVTSLRLIGALGIFLVIFNFVVKGIVPKNDTFDIIFGPAAYVYLAIVLFGFIGSFVFFIKQFLTAKGIERARITYVFWGLTITISSSVIVYLILPLFFSSQEILFNNLPILGFISNLGLLSVLFFTGLTTYAILKHQLFDIRVIIRKVFLYTSLLSIVFGTYTVFAFLLTSILPLNQTISSFLAAAVIAFGFEPLRKWLRSITEKYLFVADYNADEEFKHLTEALSNVVDLDEALRQVIQHLTRAMKLSRAAALVLVRDSKDVVTVRRIQEVAFPGSQRLMAEEYLPIVTLFLHEPRIRLVDLMQQEVDEHEVDDKTIKHQVSQGANENLPEQISDQALKKQALVLLKKLKIAVVVPIMVKEKLIGLIYLGEKLSNANFFEDDLNFITLVGSQTGSAIEKARFYEEDQLKSEFVSIASHELLTPTTAIEGYLSMILDENMAKVDPKAREYLEKVYASSKRLSALVKDLLSVSRIEAGRMKIEPKVFDMGELVAQQVDQLIFKAKDAGLTLSYIKPKKELLVFADPDRAAQAVVNLVGNAIKYTKQGSVTIELFDRPRHIEVAVTDTGIGIKPEDREHLFEKFQRVNSKETTGIIGSGLGLYITKSIIELMNGVVTVKSTYGKGSTFAFTLPKKNPSRK